MTRRRVIVFYSPVMVMTDTHTAFFIRGLPNHDPVVIGTADPQGQAPACRHYRMPRPFFHFWSNRTAGVTALLAMLQRLMNHVLGFIYLVRARPHIISATEPDGLAVSILYKSVFGAHIVFDAREVFFDRLFAISRRHKPTLNRILASVLRLCSHAIDLTVHVSHERRRVYRFLHGRTIVCHIYPHAPAQAPAKAGLAPSPVRIIHAGAIRETYDASCIIRAAEACAHDGIVLVVLGGIAGTIDEQTLLDRLIADGVIELHPPMPHQAALQLIAGAHVGVSSVIPIDIGHFLAQPRKLYEYLGTGTPVIGADVPTIARVIERHACGWVYRPSDAVALANAFRTAAAVVRDPTAYQQMVERTLRASRAFSADTEIMRYRDAVERL